MNEGLSERTLANYTSTMGDWQGQEDLKADTDLDQSAVFHYWIDTYLSYGTNFNGYDDNAHAYKRAYIRPATHTLLCALGPWDLSFSIPFVPFAGGEDGDIPPPLPEGGRWFDWEIHGEYGYHEHRRLPPVGMLAPLRFELPDLGNYWLTLRVIFDGFLYGEQTAWFLLRDFLIVSVGDSSASGEGNPDRNGEITEGGWKCEHATLSNIIGLTPEMFPEAEWMEKQAHRSLTNGPTLAAQSLQHVVGTSDFGGRATLDVITFASFARSGAKIVDGLFHAQTQPPNEDFIGVGQIEEARRTCAGRGIDALLINIGGNDIGFEGVLSDLVAGDNVFTANDANQPEEVAARIDALLDQLWGDFDLLRSTVEGLLNPRAVYITGYPTALFDERHADGTIGFHACGVFQGADLDIDSPDYDLIKAKGSQLNYIIKSKARQFGWHFIDIAADFVGRGYCDDETLWVGAETSCRTQGDFDGTMHPNRTGHLLWASRFAEQLRAHTVVPPGYYDPNPQLNLDLDQELRQ
jgi:hypothetical protein